jgi:hypothetical protein
MLPLLEYSTKKEQMLQEYYAQLRPQFEEHEPWEGAPAWAVLTGEVDVLLRETTQLYVDLVRADEFHHIAQSPSLIIRMQRLRTGLRSCLPNCAHCLRMN